ncbi:hypothetical protein LTR78_000953 [Recurvomyces mirabilis]|uniref:Uncharacterized protein n=1 Tax=Recurvomyces mirabilis TaxID=574656 RepID=A0AAE0WWN3_9PEZI|nr:hypothetical protein LTR78_000953 [Recurvomyces mirabilis]KAK5158925.1 hypothetical protein LTS14_003033 [Recurvomyces mirabilis]
MQWHARTGSIQEMQQHESRNRPHGTTTSTTDDKAWHAVPTATGWNVTGMWLALSMLETPAPGAEVGYASTPSDGRRQSTQIPSSPYHSVYRQLPHLFSGFCPGNGTDDEDQISDDDEEPSPESLAPRENFLGRVQSYSKLMHAHTQSQLASPSVGTLLSYAKSMHAFTLNQLNHSQTTTQSARNSPQLGPGGRRMVLRRHICEGLKRLNLGETPNPANTPVHGHSHWHAERRRMGASRSLTEPVDFGVPVTRKDFAMA